MCHPKPAWFLRRLGLKTGIDFVYFGLKSGMILEGTTGVYERFNSERVIFFFSVLI